MSSEVQEYLINQFYDNYGIRLNPQTDVAVATRLLNNQYEHLNILDFLNQKESDVRQLEACGENWATMFRYSSAFTDQHYPEILTALAKAAPYFLVNNPTNSPALELFKLLGSVIMQANSSNIFNPNSLHLWGGSLSEAGAEAMLDDDDDFGFHFHSYNNFN
jgi:hypothetical protein